MKKTEDSVKGGTEQEDDDSEKNGVPLSDDSPGSDDTPRLSSKLKREDGKLRTLSGSSVYNCLGKNLRINVPLTTPSRTISAISYLVWEDLMNQSSKKIPEGSNKLHINKAKLHHAEKMIKGALIELYKGLGYLKTYRYNLLIPWVKY